MLLALFLINLAAGLYCSLPLVGRRNAGVKYYRLTLIIVAVLVAVAGAAHAFARTWELVVLDGLVVAFCALLWLVLRYPKRFIFRFTAGALAFLLLALAFSCYHLAVRPAHIGWSAIGALSSIALLGSVYQAMTLGHWYLVVRGMPIDPLKRLTIATLVATVVRVAVVIAAIAAGGIAQEVAVRQGIFFWMRAGWGLAGPLVLFPMVWGTVRLRSTMAATGIVYVDVVAVTIGEGIGNWLSALVRYPV